jgi:hypothetical protein
MKLSPKEMLWLGILLRDDVFAIITDAEARKALAVGKFPKRLIAEYLKRRAAEPAQGPWSKR